MVINLKSLIKLLTKFKKLRSNIVSANVVLDNIRHFSTPCIYSYSQTCTTYMTTFVYPLKLKIIEEQLQQIVSKSIKLIKTCMQMTLKRFAKY